MGTPELYISAQCIKITPCSNKEAKEIIEKGESILSQSPFLDYTKEVNGYIVEYINLKYWTTNITRFIKYSDVKDNSLANKIFTITKNLKSVSSSTGVSK